MLAEQTLQALLPGPGKRFVDATLGGGGHSFDLLSQGGLVFGLDRDQNAVGEATRRCARFGGAFSAKRANFADLAALLAARGWHSVDGVVFDLGVSSHQLDQPERGFSFQREAGLDMRMDPTAELTAAAVVNGYSEAKLRRIIREFGDERLAGRIAEAIVGNRPLATTSELAALVARIYPGHSRRHPATRTFQAIRIEVNGELDCLRQGLAAAVAVLRPDGRIAVISFHSLEDRLVKQFFRDRSRAWLDRPEWPEPRPNPECDLVLSAKKPLTPSAAEIARNPRARSAKLRVAQKRKEDR